MLFTSEITFIGSLGSFIRVAVRDLDLDCCIFVYEIRLLGIIVLFSYLCLDFSFLETTLLKGLSACSVSLSWSDFSVCCFFYTRSATLLLRLYALELSSSYSSVAFGWLLVDILSFWCVGLLGLRITILVSCFYWDFDFSLENYSISRRRFWLFKTSFSVWILAEAVLDSI